MSTSLLKDGKNSRSKMPAKNPPLKMKIQNGNDRNQRPQTMKT